MKWIGPTIGACVCAAAMSAGAGALDECMIRGDRATVTRCLADSIDSPPGGWRMPASSRQAA